MFVGLARDWLAFVIAIILSETKKTELVIEDGTTKVQEVGDRSDQDRSNKSPNVLRENHDSILRYIEE